MRDLATDNHRRFPLGSPARFPGLIVAALASVGAGAIHGAAAGIHAEHTTLARLFVVAAATQIGAGVWALLRPSRVSAVTLAAVNALAVGAWLATRLRGFTWPAGLELREAPRFADTMCAGLGALAAGCALGALLIGKRPAPTARPMFSAAAIAVLAVPAMWVGGSNVHTHAHPDDDSLVAAESSDGHDGTAPTHDHGAAPAHDHGATTTRAVPQATSPPSASTESPSPAPASTAGATTPAVDVTAAAQAVTWPRAWDPAQPLDLTGVPGVSAEQEARAVQLVEDSLRDLPRWSTTDAAVADGYRSIGDAATGSEHYIKYSLINDDVILDPTQPESLVYTVDGDRRTLAGAMFIVSARPTDDPTVTNWAGPLMTWHNHGDLCWSADKGVPQVVGTTRADGTCATGVNTGGENPMVHVWITPHPCGVFAALEGVGAGQAAVSDAERTDFCSDHGHDNHGHDGPDAHGHADTPSAAPTGAAPADPNQPAAPATATPATPAEATPTPVPYDPSKPIDLSGTPGVTPEQQAAAENLVAINVVRLPKWADYKVAEAFGFRSIGDGFTGHEHFINWDWINDDVILDPDRPESLVFEIRADGSKKLVSAMYMLPDTVPLSDVPNIGGPLMQWHIHDDLCFTTDPEQPRVAGTTDGNGACPPGLQKFLPSPMIHVWITPHPCGPFAALEGIAAGQIDAGATRLCDHAHGTGAGLLG